MWQKIAKIYKLFTKVCRFKDFGEYVSILEPVSHTIILFDYDEKTRPHCKKKLKKAIFSFSWDARNIL